MKKLIVCTVLGAMIFTAAQTAAPAGRVAAAGTDKAEKAEKAIKTVRVFDEDKKGVATLLGDGENFIENLKVKVKFENRAPYEIILDDGYSPYMSTYDFGGENKFLFCSSQTGGSGGYGNYGVYKLFETSYKILYSDKTDGAKFSAKFEPNGFMSICDCTTKQSLDVYLSYMDSEFYNLIFSPDGSVKNVQPSVNAASFVSPALNPSSGLFRLLTYRSVTAVAEVNRLGYIVQTLSFDGGAFKPDFTEFAINF